MAPSARTTGLHVPRVTPRSHQWPTEQCWNDHKAVILDMHADRSLSYPDIVLRLWVKYKLFCTLPMLKRRLREWGARRNQKRATMTRVRRQQVSPKVSGDADMEDVNDLDPSITGVGSSFANPAYQQERCLLPDTTSAGGPVLDAYISSFGTATPSSNAFTPDAPSIVTLFWPTLGIDSAQGMLYAEGMESKAFSTADNAAATMATYPSQETAEHCSFEWPSPTTQSSPGIQPPCAVKILGASEWFEARPLCNPPEARVTPQQIRELFSRYCNETNHSKAERVASQVHFMYKILLAQKHVDALTILNTKLATMSMHDQNDQAFELLHQARDAASHILSRNHPIVWVIDYMMLQAKGEYTKMRAETLRHAYERICSALGADHHHSLVAGYLYAWRLADDCGRPAQLSALQQIQIQLSIATSVLRKTDMLWIAMLMLKARLHHSLRQPREGVRTVFAALGGMSRAVGAEKLYVLSARGRYADLLFAGDRLDEAEHEYIISAAGQVHCRGPEHPTAQEAASLAAFFFRVTGRNSSRYTREVYLAEEAFYMAQQGW